jgi:hypothetical protein
MCKFRAIRKLRTTGKESSCQARFSYIRHFIYPQHKIYRLILIPDIMKYRTWVAGRSAGSPPVTQEEAAALGAGRQPH